MHTTGSQCIENSVQLVGELSQQAGLPVICLGGRWGKICAFLDTRAVVVICRQLGFSTESNFLLQKDYACNFTSCNTIFPDPTRYLVDIFGSSDSDNVLPSTVQYVQCTSNETQLSQCDYTLRTRSRSCNRFVSVISCQTTTRSIKSQ